VWSCLLLGRWDDALMNWPWWEIAVALVVMVYGALRQLRADAPAALAGAFLVASLPLVNVHVALAGYADLPMAAYYTAAAIAFLRWSAGRDKRDAALAIVFAVACTQIKNPGIIWAMTLVPPAVIALAPRRGPKAMGAAFVIGLVVVIALAVTNTLIFQYRFHVDLDLAWHALAQSYFALGNWNLLWYGALGAALLAGRRLLAPDLAPLTTIVSAGLLFLGFVFAFSNASEWATSQTTVNRATLHLAPLVVILAVLAFRAFGERWGKMHPAAGGAER
jgi:hypothetical protein